MDLVTRLFGHDRWTTNRLLDLSRGLSDEQLDRRFDIGHETLRLTFDHLIDAPNFWLTAMRGEPLSTDRDSSSIDVLKARHERAYEAFERYARQAIDEQRLDEIFLDHYPYPQSVGGTILQVVLHSHQHRSEVLHMLQRLGVTDLPDGDPQEWEHDTNALPGINP